MSYWQECIENAFEESGIIATEQQIKEVVECVEGGFENYGMAFGHDCIPDPVETRTQEELRELKRGIENHENWVNRTTACKACTTTGWVRDGWGREQICYNCNGNGRT